MLMYRVDQGSASDPDTYSEATPQVGYTRPPRTSGGSRGPSPAPGTAPPCPSRASSLKLQAFRPPPIQTGLSSSLRQRSNAVQAVAVTTTSESTPWNQDMALCISGKLLTVPSGAASGYSAEEDGSIEGASTMLSQVQGIIRSLARSSKPGPTHSSSSSKIPSAHQPPPPKSSPPDMDVLMDTKRRELERLHAELQNKVRKAELTATNSDEGREREMEREMERPTSAPRKSILEIQQRIRAKLSELGTLTKAANADSDIRPPSRHRVSSQPDILELCGASSTDDMDTDHGPAGAGAQAGGCSTSMDDMDTDHGPAGSRAKAKPGAINPLAFAQSVIACRKKTIQMTRGQSGASGGNGNGGVAQQGSSSSSNTRHKGQGEASDGNGNGKMAQHGSSGSSSTLGQGEASDGNGNRGVAQHGSSTHVAVASHPISTQPSSQPSQ
eukprot:gene10764-17850_t